LQLPQTWAGGATQARSQEDGHVQSFVQRCVPLEPSLVHDSLAPGLHAVSLHPPHVSAPVAGLQLAVSVPLSQLPQARVGGVDGQIGVHSLGQLHWSLQMCEPVWPSPYMHDSGVPGLQPVSLQAP
jgi:hypothetical protein